MWRLAHSPISYQRVERKQLVWTIRRLSFLLDSAIAERHTYLHFTMLTGLRAFLLTSSDSGRLKAYPDGAIIWNEAGRITFAGNWKDRPPDQRIRWEDQRGKLVTPGFIDVHCHLPQYPVVACSGQELLPWLKKSIFPCERAFDPEKAQTEAPLFFYELKRHGITSAAVYTTID